MELWRGNTVVYFKFNLVACALFAGTVQAFAASCQGRVRVERSPLGGALFRILIPLNPAPAKGAS